MGEKTGISWTDHTFNPWWGCVKVSPACQNCYAETLSKRLGLSVWGAVSPRRWFSAAHWREPLKWNKAAEKAGVRRRVFCASMADVFEGGSSDLDDQRANLWVLIKSTPMLDWLLLTKRPENIRRMFPAGWSTPQPNVWLGVTAENQECANKRIPILLQIPAVVRFVSAEPLLGPVTFRWPIWDDDTPNERRVNQLPPVMRDGRILAGSIDHLDGLRMLDWVIVGGESSAGARLMQPEWARTIRNECIEAGVPFYFKQWGGNRPKSNGRELDGREWLEIPTGGRWLRQYAGTA